ncbi:hypothetical protein, partial [Enterococcus faecalis]|uniref:hypothetical protein n=1 Tax=Enterococcus faecalis TaxID=1351 RepID=UPI003CC64792
EKPRLSKPCRVTVFIIAPSLLFFIYFYQLLLSKAHRNFTSPQVYDKPYGIIIIPTSNHRFLLTIKITLYHSFFTVKNHDTTKICSLKYERTDRIYLIFNEQ